MCAIMGYTGTDLSLETLTAAFDKLKSRGPDDTRTLQVPGGSLLFHRLAIMGPEPAGMQPFCWEDGSAVVCNGELYGFRTMKLELEAKGYVFQSGSDCELLLPLWKEYGTDMFAMLDAEFALVLYDAPSASFIAARDPIGIRPLYYGYDTDGGIVFASEAKNLVGLCREIRPFPPGHYYAGGKFVRYADLTTVDDYLPDDLDTACRGIWSGDGRKRDGRGTRHGWHQRRGEVDTC